MTPVPLSALVGTSDHVGYADDGIVFRSDGWYEVLLEVDWSPSVREGTRFSHTDIPGQEPLHSEAIAADVLVDVSGGKQMLRASSVFGPNRTTRLVLEVWQNSGQVVEIRSAAMKVRELSVPWHGNPG
jgi:hypothetical protein